MSGSSALLLVRSRFLLYRSFALFLPTYFRINVSFRFTLKFPFVCFQFSVCYTLTECECVCVYLHAFRRLSYSWSAYSNVNFVLNSAHILVHAAANAHSFCISICVFGGLVLNLCARRHILRCTDDVGGARCDVACPIVSLFSPNALHYWESMKNHSHKILNPFSYIILFFCCWCCCLAFVLLFA